MPFHATDGDCCWLGPAEIGNPAVGVTAPAPETSAPNTSLVPDRPSVQATSQALPLHAAVGQNWSPGAVDRVIRAPVGVPFGR